MMFRSTKTAVLVVGVAIAASVGLGLPAASAHASSPNYTCTGGSVPGGTYRSLTITGQCTLDHGNVTVNLNLTVDVNAHLLAAYSGSDLVVRGDLVVRYHAVLILGCEPEIFPCFNEPAAGVHPNWTTYDHVFGSIIGQQPLMMVVHHNTIDGSITHSAGGGGKRCSVFPLGPGGPPAYSTYEDNYIGHTAVVVGLRTCWLGFIRNHVGRSVVLRDNFTADPDGNEYVTNVVGLDLRCKDNQPRAQFGDSGGSPNVVGRNVYGECRALV